MRTVYEREIAGARAIEGHILSGSDKIVPPPNWVESAKRWWPHKTAAHLAAIGKQDERTAKRWLTGEYEPPQVVALALITKLFERG